MMVKKVKNDNYAGFWLRFVAYLVDAAILSLLSSGIVVIFFLMNSPNWLSNIIIICIFWLYYAFLESSSNKASIGKMVVGLKVTDEKGKQISFARATGRYFGKYISVFLFFIGLIMIAFTKKKQGLHDLMSKTLVLKDY